MKRHAVFALSDRVALTKSIGARQSGQLLVVFAFGLVALIAFAGLLIDGGVAFLNRRDGQNTADLASMAGTKVVLDNYVKGTQTGAQVLSAIGASATSNGCDQFGATPCTWTAEYVDKNLNSLGTVGSGAIPSSPPAQGVRVTVTRQPRTYFLTAMSYLLQNPAWERWRVDTEATALTASINSLPPGQVLPIAADPPAEYEFGQTYDFTVGKDGPGNFGWLSWTGSNDPNTLATSICTPNNPLITFPQEIWGDPGKSNSSSVRACVQKWIDNGATVLIPIWAPSEGSSCTTHGQGNNFKYCIVGLAAFVITDKAQPAIDVITGVFKGYYELASVPGGYGGPPCDPTSPSCSNKSSFIGLVR